MHGSDLATDTLTIGLLAPDQVGRAAHGGADGLGQLRSSSLRRGFGVEPKAVLGGLQQFVLEAGRECRRR